MSPWLIFITVLHIIMYTDPEQDLMLNLSPLEARIPRGSDTTLTCSVQDPGIFK